MSTRGHISLPATYACILFLWRALLPVLPAYVATSERKGNSFTGSWECVLIWDMSPEGESEIPGWSVYVSGASFNHSELLVDLWLSFFVLFWSCWCVRRVVCVPPSLHTKHIQGTSWPCVAVVHGCGCQGRRGAVYQLRGCLGGWGAAKTVVE
jgi:hypothetical protein